MADRLPVKDEPEALEPTSADETRAARNWARMDPKLRSYVRRVSKAAAAAVRAIAPDMR